MTRPLPSVMPLALAATMLLAPPLLPAQTGGAPARPARIDSLQRASIDSIFAAYDKPDAPGCALGVLQNGQITYGRGYGSADLEHSIPITTATLFDVGSTSKQFAAASILLLAQEHKLALTDEVRKYIPELPRYGPSLTIDNMMRHTSGLRDYAGLLELAGHSLQEVTTDSQALALIVHQRHLNFPSGSRFEYSNTGFFLLSVIVKRVSGMPLADFARTRIFLPLGMTHTQYRNHFDMLIPNRAMGYAPSDSEGVFKNSMSNWEQTGDGAVHISIDDIMKWDENFYTPRVGGESMVSQLQQRGTLANGDSISYARGLFVGTYRGLRRVEHGGDWIGYHASYARFPVQHTSIALLCNSDGISPVALGDRVADIVLAKFFTVPKADGATTALAPPGIASQPSEAPLAGGYFASSTGEVVRILRKADSLSLGYVGHSFPLERKGPLAYVVNGLPVGVTFEHSGAGPPRAVWLRIGSADSTRAERFVPVSPTIAELRSYAGRYHSAELGVTWSVVLVNGRLTLQNAPSDLTDTGPLVPAMQSTFTAGDGVLQFVRDKSGRVMGMTLSASRMRGIEFERIDK